MITIDVFLTLEQDVDAEAERLARALGARFVSRAMLAQFVRLNFEPLPDVYVVTAEPSLRVRDVPSVLTGKVLGTLPTGSHVTAIHHEGDWLLHESALGRGWSNKFYLEQVTR